VAVGGRFDLEEARREALEAKRRAKIRSIVSNATLVAVLLAVAIGGKIGWDWWSEKRESERVAAEQARIAEERAEAEKRRAAEEKRKAEAAKREAERKALAEKREAERKAREEAREREKREREEEKLREAERRRAEAEFRAEQQELKKFEDAKVSALEFRPESHVCFEYGLEKVAKIFVDESKWGTLSAHSQKRRTADFLEALRDDTVTNVISDTCYPDRATFDHLLENLDAERFTLVVNLDDDARDRKLVLVAADKEKGLAAPEGARALKAGGRVSGWTVPFAYGDKTPFFILEQATADRFAREWSQLRRKLRIDAAKLDNRDQFVAEKLAKELPEFVRTVRIEVTSVPVETSKKDDTKKQDTKKRALMKGSSSDIRKMSGPQRR
jgi:hypothetical protein